MKSGAFLLKRLTRTFIVVFLVVIGSTALIRFAPGYLSDAREMDSRYGDAARNELSVEAARSTSLRQMLSAEISGWARGSLGLSRQYDVPVLELILPGSPVTGGLVLRAIAFAWALAFCAALLSSAGRNVCCYGKRLPLFSLRCRQLPWRPSACSPAAAVRCW